MHDDASMARCEKGIATKKFRHTCKTIHNSHPLIRSRKSIDVEIVGVEMYWYALNVSRMLTDYAKDASIAMCELLTL